MCGIVAIAGVSNVVPRLLKSLHALEYRGYDSAGIAVSVPGAIQTCRAVGRITNLEARLADAPLSGDAGLAHTRWATHGAPTESNAHPLSTSAVSLVHNGIIENYRQLRRMLENEGRTFKSETDTETVLQLADAFLAEGKPPVEAVRACVAELRGAFALVFVFRDHPGLLIAARRGSPLALGLGEHENFVASDALALAPHASKVAYLEESDLASVTRHSVQVEDSTQRPVVRQARPIEAGQTVLDTGGHRHFMAKEIHEQPGVLGGLLARRLAASHSEVLPLAIPDTDPNQPLDLIACGTANYAAMVGERWIEEIADIRAKSQLASEFRYRPTPSGPTALAVFVSQSGETADTLAALRLCRQQGRPTIGIVNVEESSVAREADTVLATHAGPEIGVASTKAFSAQLATLAFLAAHLGRKRGTLDAPAESRIAAALSETPRLMAEVIASEEAIRSIATLVSQTRLVLYLGRGTMYPVALEGALKLKEITYMHAEGYAGGELKHGPIALVDPNVAIVVLAPRNSVFEKSVSNMQEVIARGGNAILLSDRAGIAEAGADCAATVELPECSDFVAPLVYAPAIQLLAYHVAVLRGTDVDKPRNLAKSVTVE